MDAPIRSDQQHGWVITEDGCMETYVLTEQDKGSTERPVKGIVPLLFLS